MRTVNNGRDGPRDPEAYFNKTFKTAWIVSAALMLSLLLYAVVVEIFRSSHKGSLGLAYFQDIRMIRYLFYMIGALEIIVIRVLRGLLLRKIHGEEPGLLIQKLFRTSLFSAVLSEVPALLGLTLFFLTGQTRDFFILLAVSFLLIFMFLPRKENWKTWAGL
jgi:hypothetical protein